MELRDVLYDLRRWLWLIALGVFLVVGLTYWISSSMTPVYRATATLQTEIGATDPNALYAASLGGERQARTNAQLVKSKAVMDEVISGLGLNMSAQALQSMVSVGIISNTELFTVSVRDADPARAREIATKTAEVFIRQNAQARQARFSSAQKQLDTQIANLEKDIESTQAQIASIGSPTDPQNINMPQFVKTQLDRLQNQLVRDQTLYAIQLRSAEDLRLAAVRYANNVLLASAAETPSSPVEPKTTRNVILAGFIGLILFSGVVLIKEYVDDSIKSSDEIGSVLGLSTLGVISRIKGSKPEDKVVTLAHSKSPIAEAYRTLRTNTKFSSVDKPMRSLLVASANPAEGKTTTAVNLAVSLAQDGNSVILVDSDLRRPTVHRLLGVPNSTGLTNALLQDNMDNLDTYLQPTAVDTLRVLASGPLPPNPAELLGSQRMVKVIEQLKARADMVVFDSPPALVVTDAMVLASKVDGVLLVVNTGSTKRGAALKAKEDFLKVGANLVGAVLNRLTGRGGGGYYHYYYYSSDGERKRKREGKQPG